MKNLKKFAALLLVGAMALLMLTACGGGGGGSAEKTEEQKVMEKIGSQKNVHVTSDAELRAIAEAHLNEDLKIVWKLGNHAFVGGIYVNNLGDDLVITITAKYDYADTLLSDILTRLSNYIDTNVDASVNQSGTWSKVALWSSVTRPRAMLVSLSVLRTPQVNHNFSSFLPGVWLQSCPPGLFCAGWQGRGPSPFLARNPSCSVPACRCRRRCGPHR